jgi:septum formation protein
VTLLLASTSPQRRAILEQLGIPFEIVAPRYEERDPAGVDPIEAVRAHARGKAHSLLDQASGRTVLGVDTEVLLDGRTFGKPRSEPEAREMLGALAGRVHQVVSSVCLLSPELEQLDHEVTAVTFRQLADEEIEAYLETGEWRGRAGAYAIQGRGAALVERIEGDYLNVVGLPAALLARLQRERERGLVAKGSSTLTCAS